MLSVGRESQNPCCSWNSQCFKCCYFCEHPLITIGGRCDSLTSRNYQHVSSPFTISAIPQREQAWLALLPTLSGAEWTQANQEAVSHLGCSSLPKSARVSSAAVAFPYGVTCRTGRFLRRGTRTVKDKSYRM